MALSHSRGKRASSSEKDVEKNAEKDFPDNLPPVWREKLSPVLKEKFFQDLSKFLKAQVAAKKEIYPAPPNVMRALQEVDLPDVKVVILGQDPYHGPGQAVGFSFAVPNEVFPKPPSLQNIFKELQSDLKVTIPKGQSDLSGWVKQGVLLLNTVLTVEKGQPMSHRERGWEKFTDLVVQHLSARRDPIVFILWGSHAQKFKSKIETPSEHASTIASTLKTHVVLESVHPSPLSAYRGFFGSHVFSRTNELLKKMGKEPIHWEKVSENKSQPG